MMRAWTGVALLAGSWLFGLGYLQPANWPVWAIVVLLGTALSSSPPARLPPRREIGIAAAMLLPAVWYMPWPYRAAPLWIAAGLGLLLVPASGWRLRSLGWGGVKAGTILLGQSLALWAYAHQTARRHDLPWPLPSLLGGIASLLGMNAAVDGPTIAVRSMREVHRLGATWELLLDPATLCFFTGGVILLAALTWSRLPGGARWTGWIRLLRAFTLLVLAWLPVRVGLLMALHSHRALRADPTTPLTVMNQFFSPWLCLLLLMGPVLLAWWFVRLPSAGEASSEPPGPEALSGPWRYAYGLGLVIAGTAILAFVIHWDPVGRPKSGRVMFVERHSTWEPTDRPYDTAHFGHDPSYSYTRIYDYLGQYFETSRLLESDPIGRDKLSECDVLVVKTPTARFHPEEVKAITRFVENGGGLLLIGDHTNVFKSSTYLNDITRPFGFTFRHDLLFCIGSPYVQKLDPPAVPHPAVQHLPPMHYAVSCSIDPGRSPGCAVVRSTGLWSLPPVYHTENYHPQAEYRPEMRYGAFIQLWGARHGKGRVLAFTDSTIFSNFCTFQPGKAELMLNMTGWLNHTSQLDRAAVRVPVVVAMVLVALALLGAGMMLAVRSRAGWLVLLASGVLGATAGSVTVAGAHRLWMPPLRPARPMTRVVVDRTVSKVPLSLGADTQGDGLGYGLLEQWIPRLGYSTTRRSGAEAFSGDALVIICPTRSAPHEFREGLVEYVAQGGRLLVVDSPDSVGSTANSLLWPFGMGVSHATARKGELKLASDWPNLQTEATCEILGGEPFMWVDDMPVAARTRYNKGSVMAIGFGLVMNDAAMGGHWMLAPEPSLFRRSDLDPDLLKRYDLLFALVGGLVEDRPVAAPRAASTPSGAQPSDMGR